ncbi:hypothetical protein Nham_1613 [Nitrobacter hamburgensis X14]|uniref:Integrase catalytic domain-containing protein n=1 Tax=Nitrobacter hamburgensis (strain DSM 10229 / NCIMB 13809 / X14) TaxID=323097 RepID=Q1QMW5_NITHX|nr:hypothetical protein [Nitrobacter hamburgensis]ABE62432.1 hypothetical protein Nham_1613 [Nitrobacter hamburgensis X14]
MTARLTTAEFAELADISARKARSAIARALEGKTWRGFQLVVDPVTGGRGGVAGHSYLVRVDSLPTDLQQRLKVTSRPVLRIAGLTEQRGAERDWWLRILGPLLAMTDGPDRKSAVDALADRRDLTNWRGRPIRLTPRTIYRRLQKYRENGPLAFAPRARADKGRSKVVISLAAEQAIPFDTETWERIADELRNYIRGHWKAGETLKLIEGRSNIKFRELIADAGFSYFNSIPENALLVPRRFVVAERHYRNVHTLYHDRKSYEDNRFRTQRSRSFLKPMDWVIGDVHPIDILCTRDDGSTAHARMLGWLDGATNRLRFDLVLCEAGTGIRNADLIQSFCHMLCDPTWGMPRTLYIDNGSEYRFAEKINDALQLVSQLRGTDGRTTRVVHAQPYNASAKPIEGMFAIVEKMLQGVPGHTGGDRMNKKTERVGRPTKAFPGTFDMLRDVIRGRIHEMEMYPMRGHLAGRSPRQAYEAAIEQGWQPVTVDDREILTVFADDRVCTIAKGVINVNGRRWACDEMSGYFKSKIIARIPKYWPPQRMALLDYKTREIIGIADPVEAFAFDDPRGAMLSKQVDKARRKAIRQLDRSTPDVDTLAEGLRLAAQMTDATVATPIARIGLSDEAAVIARHISETPAARADRQHEKNLKAQRRQSIALDNTLKALKGK